LAFDILADWDGYTTCPKPVHKWMLSSYVLLALLLAVDIAAKKTPSGGATCFLLNARPKGAAMKFMFSCTWLLLVPLFTAWSALGTAWAWEVQTRAPHCLPSSTHLFLLIVWQVVSWAWVLFYSAMGFMSWRVERRVRRAEQDLRELEDPDLVARWGHVGNLDGYSQLPAKMASGGLTPAQIRGLPGVATHSESQGCSGECPICLTGVIAGETVRKLPGCCHVFHRSCIDLWLLRSSECPLCKQSVLMAGEDARE